MSVLNWLDTIHCLGILHKILKNQVYFQIWNKEEKHPNIVGTFQRDSLYTDTLVGLFCVV